MKRFLLSVCSNLSFCESLPKILHFSVEYSIYQGIDSVRAKNSQRMSKLQILYIFFLLQNTNAQQLPHDKYVQLKNREPLLHKQKMFSSSEYISKTQVERGWKMRFCCIGKCSQCFSLFDQSYGDYGVSHSHEYYWENVETGIKYKSLVNVITTLRIYNELSNFHSNCCDQTNDVH